MRPEGATKPATPVAEAIAIGRDGHGRVSGQMIGHDDVGRPRKMRAQYRDQGRRLYTFVQFTVLPATKYDGGSVAVIFVARSATRWLRL